MKRHEPSHEKVQRTIDEQEQAMADLLMRVMASPLAPLHKTITSLQAQFTDAQRDGANVALQMQTSLDAMRQRQDAQMNRLVEIATDARSASNGLEDLDDLLTERHDSQAARNQHVQDQLTGLHTNAAAAEQSIALLVAQTAAELRTQLHAQSADHADRLAVATHAINRIDTSLNELRARIDAVAPRFDALAATVQEAASDSARQATTHTTYVNTGLAELRVAIDAVAPAMAPRFDTLAATVQEADSNSAHHYHSLSESQKAVVSAAVQQQLAPFQAKSRFLLAFSALSCASTVALLYLHFIH